MTAAHVVGEETAHMATAYNDQGEVGSLGHPVVFSPPDQLDFAVYELRVETETPAATPLPVSSALPPERGTDTLFSGYPHGVPDLLVQRAIVAGYQNDESFYLDGPANAGNSGGPVIEAETGSLLGVITDSRFLGGADLDSLATAAESLRQHAEEIRGEQGGGGITMMGVDFAELLGMIAKSSLILQKAIEANANTGLAIALSIDQVVSECREAGVL